MQIKHSFTLCTCLLLLFHNAAGNTNPRYSYTVDLEHIEADRVYVELLTPRFTENTTTFYIPKIIPGTYSIYDFGRFISGFKAMDIDGRALHVERSDINTFIISDARSLYKVSYWVDDTFDDKRGVPVFGMSGTNIEADGAIVLNGHGFFGYFEGMKDAPFEVIVKKQEGYYGASAMTATYPDARTEIFEVPSYGMLVDMPILYSRPDTTTIHVAGSEVLIAVSSPGGNATSEFIAKNFADVLQAECAYMGGELPVDKYAFLMYFLKQGQQVGTGALEHNYSSLYVLPDVPQERFIQPIKDIAAHEFFHIITPLTVHSEEIGDFDFNEPRMSRHLWMYEGVTEYFAHHAQLVYGLTDMEYFLNEMQGKITHSLNMFDDRLPFTELSEDCLVEHHAQYGNVYEKGALIGLCLDVLLRQESNGEEGLIDLMLALKDRYGKDRAFRDKKLFREIGAMTSADVKKFLRKYVDGKSPLPLKETFDAIGVEYTPPQMERQFTFGNISLDYNKDRNRVIITSVEHMNAFGRKMGYQAGDEIIAINGQGFDPQQPMALFWSERAKFVEGEPLKIDIARKSRGGGEQLLTLSAPVESIEVPGPATLTEMASLHASQREMQEQWKQGAKKPAGGRS